MTERDPILDYPAADFYRVVGDDDDYHRDALDALVQYYRQSEHDPPQMLLDLVQKGCIVECFNRVKMPRLNDDIVDTVLEEIEGRTEELWNPEGDHLEGFDNPACRAIRPVLLSTIQAMADAATVWHCEKSGEWLVTGEVLEIYLRQEMPRWFQHFVSAEEAQSIQAGHDAHRELQFSEWLAGRPFHNQSRQIVHHEDGRFEVLEGGTCCPDFSCCKPELLAPVEARQAFMTGTDEQREALLGAFLRAAMELRGVSQNAYQAVYIAGSPEPS